MGTGETGTIRSPSWFHRASDGSDAQMHILRAVDCGKNVQWNVTWNDAVATTFIINKHHSRELGTRGHSGTALRAGRSRVPGGVSAEIFNSHNPSNLTMVPWFTWSHATRSLLRPYLSHYHTVLTTSVLLPLTVGVCTGLRARRSAFGIPLRARDFFTSAKRLDQLLGPPNLVVSTAVLSRG